MLDTRSVARGFTLIELLVTMAVAAILISVAVPNFRIFVVNNRLATQANDLVTSLSFARNEAVKRAASVTVCASSNGTGCPAANATSTSWASGWLITDSAGTAIRVQQPLGGASTLAGGANSITYNASGRLTFPSTAPTLTLCPPSPAIVLGRAIQIELTGRTRVSSVTCP